MPAPKTPLFWCARAHPTNIYPEYPPPPGIKCSQLKRNFYQLSKCMYNRSMIYILYLRVNLSIINWIKMDYMPFLCYIYLAIEVRNIYTHLLYNKTLYYVQLFNFQKACKYDEIILARSNQLVIQLNSLALVQTPLGRTCINRRSVQNGHSTLSPGNPEWPELTVIIFMIRAAFPRYRWFYFKLTLIWLLII